jgi:hypothetical protein
MCEAPLPGEESATNLLEATIETPGREDTTEAATVVVS